MGARSGDPAEVDPPGPVVALRESGSLRGVNVGVRRASEVLGLSDPIAFFCECRLAACYAVVWLSASAFDARVADGTGWLLAEGHVPSVPWSQVAAAVDRSLVLMPRSGELMPGSGEPEQVSE